MNNNISKNLFERYSLPMILLLALMLRLFLLGNKSFWVDEGVTWFIGIGEISSDAHPPLYFLILRVFIALFGDSEFAGRLPSAVFGWLTVLFAYLLVKENFGKKPALLLAGFLAISPFLIPIDQEMRMYSLIGLEIILILFFFFRVIKNKDFNWLSYLGLTFTAILSLYTYSLFTIILAYLAVIFLVVKKKEIGKLWLKLLLLSSAVILTYLPQLIKLLSITGERNHVYAYDWIHLKVNILRVFKSLAAFFYGDSLIEFIVKNGHFIANNPLIVILTTLVFLSALLLLYIFFSGIRKFKSFEPFSLRLLLICLGLSILFLLLFCGISASTSRHLIFAFIPLPIVIVLIISNEKPVLQYTSFTAYIFLSISSLWLYYRAPLFLYEKADWRSAGELISHNLVETDAVYYVRGRNGCYTTKYYLGNTSNDLYYRYRPNYPETDPSHHLINWDPREFTPQDWIKDLMEKYPRLWVLESDYNWGIQDDLEQLYKLEVWDFGEALQVRLYSRR